MKAMVLAAGLGTRLQPYTHQRPKPLFPILNIPLLLHTLANLQAAGFQEIAVNCHHLGPQIEHAVAGIRGVTVFREDVVLGTGGGLRNALEWLGKEPVLVVNGDIYHTIDYGMVYDTHLKGGQSVTLVLHDFPRFNKVSVDALGAVIDFIPCGQASEVQAFTGIHVLDPKLLAVIPEASFYDIITCYRYWMAKGMRIQSFKARDHYWSDMGTPADYLDLHAHLLTDPRFGASSPFCLAEGLNLSDVELHEWSVVGQGAHIGAGASLTRVVVWDGAIVPPGSQLMDTIVA
ncbi:MAG: NTP transferase domain-containing protein [Proteobacteria bacterium]|nr:NTP transferase domain-containing protein [Pseudomonadota bacterium]MBU1640317.1 NTP transferase domain-containing protein [Pseudomonadota bacterium]